MLRPAPALKPSRIVSLTKLVSVLRRSAQAVTASAATRRATSDATCASRTGSPAAIGAMLAPTSSEIADVGPMARCREEPSSA